MLAVHYQHPDTNPFYNMEEGLKKGGRKKHHRKSKKDGVHVNVHVSNKLNVGRTLRDGGKQRQYADQNHVMRFTAPNRRMTNRPRVLSYNSFAVPPTQITDFRRPAEHGHVAEKKGPWEKDWGEQKSELNRSHVTPYSLAKEGNSSRTPFSTLDVPNGRTVPIFTANENPAGIAPVSTLAQRATPSGLGVRGGVFYEQPEQLKPEQYGNEDPKENYANASVSYFKPRGRDNIPSPADRQFTAAEPVDFFPLRGQSAVPREEEQQRSAFRVVHPVEPLPYSYSRQGTPALSTDSPPGEPDMGFAFKGLHGSSLPKAASPSPPKAAEASVSRKPLLPEHLWPKGVKLYYNKDGKKVTSYAGTNPSGTKDQIKAYYDKLREELKAVEKEHGYKRGGRVHAHSVFH